MLTARWTDRSNSAGNRVVGGIEHGPTGTPRGGPDHPLSFSAYPETQEPRSVWRASLRDRAFNVTGWQTHLDFNVPAFEGEPQPRKDPPRRTFAE
jgi:hypothetical protein